MTNKKIIINIGTMSLLTVPIISVVSCGAYYVIDQYDSSNSTISQLEFDKKIEELKTGKRNKFNVTFINSIKEKRSFTLTKQNAEIMEEKIKNFLNIFDNKKNIFKSEEQEKVNVIKSIDIKSIDGINVIDDSALNAITGKPLYALDMLKQKNILKNIKKYFTKTKKISGWNIILNENNQYIDYEVNSNNGTVSYTVKAFKKGYNAKYFKINYSGFYKMSDYKTKVFDEILKTAYGNDDLFKSFLKNYSEINSLNLVNYQLFLKEYFKNRFIGLNDLKIVDDINSTKTITNTSIKHSFYFVNKTTNKVFGSKISINWTKSAT